MEVADEAKEKKRREKRKETKFLTRMAGGLDVLGNNDGERNPSGDNVLLVHLFSFSQLRATQRLQQGTGKAKARQSHEAVCGTITLGNATSLLVRDLGVLGVLACSTLATFACG